MKPRILIIRGGAIGDFILTLPALGLIRDAFPAAHIEIIGYRHIVALAEGRHYADASRSIEYGPLAGFFARNGNLNPELEEYFGSFQQVISFLFDPDGIFEANLARCGVKNFLAAHSKIDDTAHASQQLAGPLQRLALYLDAPESILHLTDEDRRAAADLLGSENAFIAIHPGSGSPRKNWPITQWQSLIATLIAEGRSVILVGGEADARPLADLRAAFGDAIRILQDIPLPTLGAILARSGAFIGHDSGISHLAAASGAKCVLLFGPTDPAIWAPLNPGVKVLTAPDADLTQLDPSEVLAAL